MQRNNTCNTTSDSSSKQRQTIVNLTTTQVHIQQTYICMYAHMYHIQEQTMLQSNQRQTQ